MQTPVANGAEVNKRAYILYPLQFAMSRNFSFLLYNDPLYSVVETIWRDYYCVASAMGAQHVVGDEPYVLGE